MICLVACTALFESKEIPNDAGCKVTAIWDVGILITNIFLLAVYSFFYQPQMQWFCIFLTVINSWVLYNGYRTDWPYYSDYINKMFFVITGLFHWGNLVLIVVEFLQPTTFSGGLQIYFLGIPLTMLIIIYSKDERVELLNKNINNFQRGEDMSL